MAIPFVHDGGGNATSTSEGTAAIVSSDVLQRVIVTSLASYDYVTSLFMAERLCALDTINPSLAIIPLQDRPHTLVLARVHMANGQPRRVYSLLKGATNDDARFLFARACYDINRYHEGEAALLANGQTASKDTINVPHGAAGHYLLGIIALRTGRRSDAADCFRRCITLDSFHWAAIQALCELGASHDTTLPIFDARSTPHTIPLSSSSSSSSPSSISVASASSSSSSSSSLSFPLLSASVPLSDIRGSLPVNGALFTPSITTSSNGNGNGNGHVTASGLSQPNFATPSSSSLASSTPSGTRSDMSALSTPPIANGGMTTPAPVAPKGRKAAKSASTTVTTARITRSASGVTPSTSSTVTPSTKTRGGVVARLNYDTTTRRDTRHTRTASNDHSGADDDNDNDDTNDRHDINDDKDTPTGDSSDDNDASDARVTRRGTRFSASTTEKKAKVEPSSRRTRGNAKRTPSASSSSSSSSGVPPAAPRRGVAAKKLSEIAELDDGDEETKRRVPSDTKVEKEHKGVAVTRSSSSISSSSSSSLATPRTPVINTTSTQPSGDNADRSDADTIMDTAAILRSIAEAYRYQCNFDCKEAIDIYSQLPRNQYQTGWVFAQLGRCYVELGDYRRACSMYQQSRRVDPHRTAGMEWYSTALWHLQRKKELSFLGQQMVEFDRLAPQTWIVVGTCFSLQKEHDTALKFFRRAIQLDSYNAYAHTLAAHEHVANEEYEKAIAGYRLAFSLDERLYNAWVGIANTYQRQEKLDVAIYHFKRALEVNSRSPVLCTCLALALKLDNKLEEAFALLQRAEELTTGARQLPTIKFYRALVLIANDQYQDALLELEACRELHPTEAKIHFQLGEVYRRLDMKDRAALSYVACLDLDPKEKNIVKAALENLQRSDDDNAPEFQE